MHLRAFRFTGPQIGVLVIRFSWIWALKKHAPLAFTWKSHKLHIYFQLLIQFYFCRVSKGLNCFLKQFRLFETKISHHNFKILTAYFTLFNQPYFDIHKFVLIIRYASQPKSTVGINKSTTLDSLPYCSKWLTTSFLSKNSRSQGIRERAKIYGLPFQVKLKMMLKLSLACLV